jgi:hypothetical protein
MERGTGHRDDINSRRAYLGRVRISRVMAALLCPAKFGSLPSGEAVELWTLKGHGGLVVEAITYGGIVTRILRAPRPRRRAGRRGARLQQPRLVPHAAIPTSAPSPAALPDASPTPPSRSMAAPISLRATIRPIISMAESSVSINASGPRPWTAPMARPPCALPMRSPDGEEGYPGNRQRRRHLHRQRRQRFHHRHRGRRR